MITQTFFLYGILPYTVVTLVVVLALAWVWFQELADEFLIAELNSKKESMEMPIDHERLVKHSYCMSELKGALLTTLYTIIIGWAFFIGGAVQSLIYHIG
jgi:hypothetical protein